MVTIINTLYNLELGLLAGCVVTKILNKSMTSIFRKLIRQGYEAIGSTSVVRSIRRESAYILIDYSLNISHIKAMCYLEG